MAKKLRYVRHSKKEGAIIGREGLNYAAEKAPAGEYTDVFHGPLYRTAQTALAVVCALGSKAMVHVPVAEIGSDELFATMVNDEFKAAVKSGKTNIEALFVSDHGDELVASWTTDAALGVEMMLNQIPDDGFGIAFGHDPIIPLAARGYGSDVPSLKEMEYIDFILDNGVITIVDPRQ